MAVRRWLLDLPTRVHLWTAERELRAATTATAPASRHRQLDLLREYRRGREFPRHHHRRPVPCFVDDAGRHCAVAHLMARAGEHHAVGRIVAADNFARLRDMDLAPLRDWQRRSGLSVAELARIQPTYGFEPDAQAASFAVYQLALSPFALVSIVLNLLRLTRGWLRSSARVAGIVAGALLLGCVAVIAWIDVTRERVFCSSGLWLPEDDMPPSALCDSVTPNWPLVLAVGGLGLAALAVVWFSHRRSVVLDELLDDD
jgi:hypothetical protein